MEWDLVIFDCDGTLVDTETMYNECFSLLLAECGVEGYTPLICRERFTGYGIDRAVREVEVETGCDLPGDFIFRYETLANIRMEQDIGLIDGVHETLSFLSGRLRMCVGSNGERSNVLTSIRGAGLTDFFDVPCIFTKDMVFQGKPAPDLFLHAADVMGSMPHRTLVIEDSETGTLAGKAAGMKVIGLTAAYHDKSAQEARLRQAGATHVTERFADIPYLIGL